MKKAVLLRVDPQNYRAIKAAADAMDETVTAFFLKAALLRMQTGGSPATIDPFEQALIQLRARVPAVELSPRAAAAVKGNRQRTANGNAVGAPAESGSRILGRRKKAAR